jgi:hypothetical protein
VDEKLEKRGLNMSLEHGSAGLPTPPCNPSIGNDFYDGGHETIIFTDIQGSTAFGTYDDDGSAVTLTLLPYDMAELVDGRQDELLCGLRFGLLAPPDLIRQSPCGA